MRNSLFLITTGTRLGSGMQKVCVKIGTADWEDSVANPEALEWFEERIAPMTREHVRPRPVYSSSASRVTVSWVKPELADKQLVSCRMVRFTSPATN